MERSDRFPVPSAARRLALALLLVVPLLTVGVGAGSAALAQDDIVITMVTDTAGLGDQNFNDLAWGALEQAETEFGIERRVIESNDQASYETNLIAAAEQGDLTVAVGALLTDAVDRVAPQFADHPFVLIDGESPAENVTSVLFREQEGAFLAGVVAGLTTETDMVGVIGGIKIPPVVRYAVGFEAGVRSVNSDATVIVGYADTFSDPNVGRELTLAQYNQGADIVFPVAGLTGVGSFDAAIEYGEGVQVIAADTDQSQLGAEQQLAVSTKGVDTSVFGAVEELVNGGVEPGVRSLGLAEGGVGLATPGDRVAPEVLDVAAQYEQAIIDGSVVVPATEEELESFEPVAPDALGGPAASPAASPAA